MHLPAPARGRQAALLIAALLLAGSAQARLKHAHSTEQVEGRDAVANEIIVRFKNPSAAARAALERDEDVDESARIGNGRHAVFHSRSRSASQLLQRLRARPAAAGAAWRWPAAGSLGAGKARAGCRVAAGGRGQSAACR